MKHSERYTLYLEKMQENNRLRTLPLQQENAPVIDFSTNDYLGLSKNAQCIEEGYAYALEYGMGATGSRLLSGNSPLFEQFEARIALDKGTDRALLFPTGYQANCTVLAQLVKAEVLGKKVRVLFDKSNHASLYHSLFSSNVEYTRFAHNNVEQVRLLLERYASEECYIFLVVESLYGMDGDIAPLAEYIALCQEFSVFLYIDEAHATGMYGPRGYGISTNYNFSDIEHCIMGTMSKGLGGMGAYIASSACCIEYLIASCGGFIYSTAPSPMMIGAMYSAWKHIPNCTQERAQIISLAKMLRTAIANCGYITTQDATHIVPLISKDATRIYELHNALQQNGIRVSYIRPPTVPPNTTRLRFAVTAKHTQEDIEQTIAVLQKYS